MNVFSEELYVLDQNTMKLMIDEMQEENEELKNVVEDLKDENEELKKQLAEYKSRSGEK